MILVADEIRARLRQLEDKEQARFLQGFSRPDRETTARATFSSVFASLS